jgi:hypothetical protein
MTTYEHIDLPLTRPEARVLLAILYDHAEDLGSKVAKGNINATKDQRQRELNMVRGVMGRLNRVREEQTI